MTLICEYKDNSLSNHVKLQLLDMLKKSGTPDMLAFVEACIPTFYGLTVNRLDIIRIEYSLVSFNAYMIKQLIETCCDMEVILFLEYNQNDITFYFFRKGDDSMVTRLNFIIPYKTWRTYVHFIKEINDVVSINGIVVLYVNNSPYSLESFLYVETEQPENVREIARKYHVNELSSGKDLSHYTKQTLKRGYNSITLTVGASVEEVLDSISLCYLFDDEETLRKRGVFHDNIIQDKVFLSYCHKDNEQVASIEQQLKDAGIPVWKDTLDIELGECITEKISEAMATNNIFLLCLSQHTLNALYAKRELITLYNQILVYKDAGKRVIPIRLDDVNPNDIISGLGDFKYVDYSDKPGMCHLIELLQQELNIG